MCGIAGFFSAGGLHLEPSEALARRMANALVHRGPDDSGVWVDADAGIALAHRRLSILDLTPAGHQPMVSLSGRYVVVFNGEIYNHLELRALLAKSEHPKRTWRGHCDTETLLAAVEQWGLNAASACSHSRYGIDKKGFCPWHVTVWAKSRCITAGRAKLSYLVPN